MKRELKYKAVIFDMDGLLLDTEQSALKTFMETCKIFNIGYDRSIYLQCIGTNEEKTREILCSIFGPGFSYEKFSEIWFQKFDMETLDRPVPFKKGAVKLLKKLEKICMPLAVATSTGHDDAVIKLKNSDIIDYFRFVIAGDQIEKCKPDPEIYLRAAEKLGVYPAQCLAFEDSENGVKSAVAAGMHVIQVPDLVQPSEEIKALGHAIFNSLNDVCDRFDELFTYHSNIFSPKHQPQ